MELKQDVLMVSRILFSTNWTELNRTWHRLLYLCVPHQTAAGRGQAVS